MSESTAGFSDAYKQDLHTLLGLGEEISLFHEPNVTVRGYPFINDVDTVIDGTPITDFQNGSLDYKVAREIDEVGKSELLAFGMLATMHLWFAEIDAQGLENEGLGSEQQTQADAIVQAAREKLGTAQYTYQRYVYAGRTRDETVRVISSRATDARGVCLARQLTIGIQDAVVDQVLVVQEMPVSLAGDTALSVKQTVEPALDDALQQMSDFFLDGGDLDGYHTITDLFRTGIPGKSPEGIDELVQRYAAKGQADEVRMFVDAMIQRVEHHKAARALTLDPDFDIPSAGELAEYQGLLGGFRT